MANLNDYGYVDLSQYDAWGEGFSPIPDGEYKMAVTYADIVSSKNGNDYLKTCYTVTEGPYVRRKVWDRFMLWIDKPMIALRKYKSLRTALGLNPNNLGTTEELMNREFICVVKQRDRYGSDNEKDNFADAYLPLNVPKPRAPKATMPSAPAAGSEEDVPW